MLLRLYVTSALMGLAIMVIGLFVIRKKLPLRAGLGIIWILSVLLWGFSGWIFYEGNGDIFDLVCFPGFAGTITAAIFGAMVASRYGHKQDKA